MINIVPDGYVLDVDCYMDASRFDVEKWDYLKRFVDDFRVQYYKPTEFSREFIIGAFKPIRHTITNAVIRDQEFQFLYFIAQQPLLEARYNIERGSYLLTINFKKHDKLF